jgi:hypothetical protein
VTLEFNTTVLLDGAAGPFSVLAQGTGGVLVRSSTSLQTRNTGPLATVSFDGPQAAPGSWQGIHGLDTSGINLSYVSIAHGIHGVWAQGDQQESMTLDHLTVSDSLSDGILSTVITTITSSNILRSGGDGVRVWLGPLTITDTHIDNAARAGIETSGGYSTPAPGSGDGSAPVTVQRNVITNSGTGNPKYPAIWLRGNRLGLGPGQAVDGNTGAGNGIDAISMVATTDSFSWISPSNSSVLHALGYIAEHLVAKPGATFTFPANAVVKVGGGRRTSATRAPDVGAAFDMSSGGTFDASAGGMTLTALSDDSVGPSTCQSVLAVSCAPKAGDAGAVSLLGSDATIIGATMSYQTQAIRAAAMHLVVTDTTVRHAMTGIYQIGDAVINVTNSTFADIGGTGIEAQAYPSSSSALTVSGSTFTNVGSGIDYYGLGPAVSLTGNHVNGALGTGFLAAGGTVTATNNVFQGTELPMIIRGAITIGPGGTVSGNTGDGNRADVIHLDRVTVSNSFTWVSPAINSPGQALGYVETNLVVGTGATLTIPANAVVRGNSLIMSGSTLDASAGGATFTSLSDTSAPVPVVPPLLQYPPAADSATGPGLQLEASGTAMGSAVILGAVMRHAWGVHLNSGATLTAGGRTAGLVLTGTRIDTHYAGEPSSSGAAIAQARGYGVSVTNGTAALQCDRIENNAGGLWIAQAGSSIAQSDLAGNRLNLGGNPALYDLEAAAPVDARNNWWGQPGGPVSGQVDHPENALTSPALGSQSGCAPTAEPGGPQLVVAPASVSFGSIHTTRSSRIQVYFFNGGNTALHLGSVDLSPAPGLSTSHRCDGITLAPLAECEIDINFAPTSGGLRTAELTVHSDAGTVTKTVSGTGDASRAATATVGGIPSYIEATGSVFEVDATAYGNPSLDPMATGTITGYEGNIPLGTWNVNQEVGTAGGPVMFCTAGRHQVTFVYSGDGFFAGSTSSPITVVVTGADTTSTGSSPSAVASTVSANPATIPADGSTVSTVRVVLRDGCQRPIAGKAVALARIAGDVAPLISAPSGPSDASGVVTFTVKSTAAGSATFRASDTTDGMTITQTASITFTPGAVSASHSSLTESPGSVPADGSTTSTITATLKDASDNPVSGKTVSLTKSYGPGAPGISPPSGPSDANGVVTFAVKSTTAGTDTFQATDTTDSVLIADTADVTFAPGPVDADASKVSATPTSVPADGMTTSTITVTLKDSNSNPVSGKAVTLAKTGGPGSPTISGPTATVTNASGQVTFTIKSATPGTDSFQATDTSDSVVIAQTASVTFTPGAVSAAQSTVSASPTSVPADGITTSTITVTLKDANNNSVSGKALTLAKSSGPGTPVITGPAPATTDGSGQTTFTVRSTIAGTDVFQATDTTDSVVITQTADVTFTTYPPALPNAIGSRSTQQYSLANSDGTTWQEIDTALRVVRTPAQNRSALLTANADLFTATAGYNQDLAIFVSDNGGADTLLTWKESGGFAGTFSPNAAYAQVLYNMTGGHTYTFKLKWKTNKSGSSSLIYAGAGPLNSQYSPTTLIAETFQPGVVPSFKSSIQQYSLANSNGSTWQTIDGAKLATTLTPSFDSVAVLGGNADLWTSGTGVNQDLAILVNVDGGADQLLAWKESGGFGGTFSPNAAFVKGRLPMTAGHTYAFRLAWKSNTNVSGTGRSIFAGAGPISSQFSPTSLLVQTVAASQAPPSASSMMQYSLTGSNGSTWQLMDPGLNVTVSPAASGQAILGGNADLWTQDSGYTQDIAIFVSDNGGTDTLLAWKESGGSAGTFSPNAAYVQALYPLTAGHTYVFKLKWKTNRNAPGVTIRAGAGSGPAFSPTRLIAELTQ